MERPITTQDVLEAKPSNGVLLKRGFRKKCPRCGGGHLYHGWFRMVDRCPTCGYLFEREPGFFVGAYLINFAITEGLLFISLMVAIVIASTHPGTSVVPILLVSIPIAVLAPLAFYPYSRTIWSAIDLAMTPLELPEIVAAQDAIREGEPERPEEDLGD